MLTMVSIVKNEEEALPRLLDSVEGLVDNYVVVDTGSTDCTVEVLESYGIAAHRREWVSFGHNLTEAFCIANTKGDWLLRLDADMTVSYHDGLKDWLGTEATADSYNVEIQENGTSWRLPLLVRGGMEWEYVGATHEYLNMGGRKSSDLVGLTIYHHADGSNRSDKFQRDVDLLAPGVEANDPRAIFYTAESLRCLGRTQEAIKLFDRRARMTGTWEEEAWYAEYRAATLTLELDPQKGIERLLRCHARRTERAEPLYAVENWCRQTRSGMSPTDSLFVEMAAYR